MEYSENVDVVKVAWEESILNMGQLTTKQKYQLEKAVKSGYLVKMADYTYPIFKWRYTCNLEELVRRYHESLNQEIQ
jgi:hypothetical protein